MQGDFREVGVTGATRGLGSIAASGEFTSRVVTRGFPLTLAQVLATGFVSRTASLVRATAPVAP